MLVNSTMRPDSERSLSKDVSSCSSTLQAHSIVLCWWSSTLNELSKKKRAKPGLNITKLSLISTDRKKNLGRAGSNIQHFASFTNASLLESHWIYQIKQIFWKWSSSKWWHTELCKHEHRNVSLGLHTLLWLLSEAQMHD